MKIKMTEGCTCDSFTIDDKDIEDVSDAKLRTCLTSIIHNEDRQTLIDMLIHYTRDFGKFSIGNMCECCGDCICTYEVDTFEQLITSDED